MNLKQLGVQELNEKEVESIDAGWWFTLRISLGSYIFGDTSGPQENYA
ncbi:MAG: hypothetical protein WA839_14825 [Flavobacteriaceae bacterium]